MYQPLRFYLESSFWSRLVDRSDPARRRITRRFLTWAVPRHYLLASDLVDAEMREIRDPDLRRQVLRRYAAVRKRTVPTVPEVGRIARDLIQRGCVTEKHLADAFHLGYAIVALADALVTWNLSDLARPHTRGIVSDYCWQRGFPEMRIGSPQEVGRWLNVAM